MVKCLFRGKLVIEAIGLIINSTDCYAATTLVDCTNSSTVQTALKNAAHGDTVKCNPGGTYTWSTTVAIPSTKNITLDGNGAIMTGKITLPSTANYYARVTNFTFRTSDNAIVVTGTGLDNKPWRIDHSTFDPVGTYIGSMIETWSGPGLIDNCNFINLPNYKETIHNMGYGWNKVDGWTNEAVPGSPKAIYIEDSTATAMYTGKPYNGTCLSQSYYGARTVVRNTTLNTVMVDNHGNRTSYSGRWMELYNNTITGGSLYCIRGGSGIVFGNRGAQSIFFVNEPTTDGRDNTEYGVGDGQNNVYTPQIHGMPIISHMNTRIH
ncbi:MAG: hypothetical protein A2Z20_12935 [Bdellovibrionales bacterium RBG_16_40_8]|nr:MAG: hypothetical protein A2Z20_12935 [Bdellovibrionales bacterium RBG_16_40_8]